MNELYKSYQDKQKIINKLKVLFFSNKKAFKENFHKTSINDQARLLAFLQCNDSAFYKKLNDYVGGVSLR